MCAILQGLTWYLSRFHRSLALSSSIKVSFKAIFAEFWGDICLDDNIELGRSMFRHIARRMKFKFILDTGTRPECQSNAKFLVPQ